MFHMEPNKIEILTNCPICGSTDITDYIKSFDYLVTQTEFSIYKCESCCFKFTNPRPDQNNIAFYYKNDNYISHSNINTGLVNRLYHIMRYFTVRSKFQFINSFHPGTRIIDYGCGTGVFLNHCKINGWLTAGYEPEFVAREYGISHYNLKITNSFEKLNKILPRVDVITMWHVLEHIHDFKNVLLKLKQLLSNNGIIIIAVPNPNSYDAKKYASFWAAYDLPRHLYHFTSKDIKSISDELGLKLIKVSGMKFDSFYVSILSEQNMSGKKNFLKAFFTGLTSNIKAMKTGDYSSLIFVLTVKQE